MRNTDFEGSLGYAGRGYCMIFALVRFKSSCNEDIPLIDSNGWGFVTKQTNREPDGSGVLFVLPITSP